MDIKKMNRYTIAHFFEIQADNSPGSVAVVCKDHSLTFTSLNVLANQCAAWLTSRGVTPRSNVAVVVSRDQFLPVILLGITKTGAAFIPIDPEYPGERIAVMAGDGDFILTDSLSASRVKPGNKANCLTFVPEKLMEFSPGNPCLAALENDLAYIVYTSGSTGTPKGVMIEHRGIVNLAIGLAESVQFLPGQRILAATTISFDMSLLEIIAGLLLGLTVIIADQEEKINPALLCEVIVKQEVDIIQLTPSGLRMLLPVAEREGSFRGLKKILLGGELLTPRLISRIQQTSGADIYNLYGPTEVSIFTTAALITSPGHLPIGTPFRNYTVEVLDKSLCPCAENVEGELYIGGTGLARGYLNKPELTNKAFIKTGGRGRLYKTGDRGIRRDGHLYCLGRFDDQVKVRGHRVELREIEAVLSPCPGVGQCLVLGKNKGESGTILCCYMTRKRNTIDRESVSESEFISFVDEFLKARLPDYYIPGFYYILDTFPLTPNGKIDKKKLPAPGREGNEGHNKGLLSGDGNSGLHGKKTAGDESTVWSKGSPDIDSILERVAGVLHRMEGAINLSVPVTPGSSLQTYGIDSISFIQLVVYIEEEFKVSFDHRDLNNSHFPRFRDLCQYILNKTARSTTCETAHTSPS